MLLSKKLILNLREGQIAIFINEHFFKNKDHNGILVLSSSLSSNQHQSTSAPLRDEKFPLAGKTVKFKMPLSLFWTGSCSDDGLGLLDDKEVFKREGLGISENSRVSLFIYLFTARALFLCIRFQHRRNRM